MSDDFYHDDPIEEKTTRKFRNNLLSSAAVVIASVFFFQSTLAGNITLSSGRAIEFGQGVSQTVACSGANNLTLTPYSTFTNAAGAGGTHYFSSFTVSGIPSSCDGAQFQVNAYGNSNASPLALYNTTSTDVIVADMASTFRLDTRATGVTLTNISSSSFTVTFDTPVATSDSVFKLTIQSTTNSIQTTYSLGNTGPGGGKIFYVASTPFACGPTRTSSCTYLEAAPSGWNNGLADPKAKWSNAYGFINNVGSPETATATAIGWGYRNTRAIILAGNTDTGTASALADSYTVTVGGVVVDDWYLPSLDELNEMYTRKTNIGGFDVLDYYWSSTDSTSNSNNARRQYFGNGENGTGSGKLTPNKVRPIRAF
ncbi:MAG: hypothetical protein NTY85_05040 [Actinobacteria bacterium]|nr:hypothetical protein [Actinomycetota bacterium]